MDYRETAQMIAEEEGVDPDLFIRLVEAESSFRPDVTSTAGAYGLTQLVFNPNENRIMHRKAHELKSEYVIRAKGVVRKRPPGTENKKLPTGEIEILLVVLFIPVDDQHSVVPLQLGTQHHPLRQELTVLWIRHDVREVWNL